MAICDKSCCNAKAREAERQAKVAAFEAWLAERDRQPVAETPVILTVAEAPEDNDVSYGEALLRARLNEVPH